MMADIPAPSPLPGPLPLLPLPELGEASLPDDESPMMYAAPAASKSAPGSFTGSRRQKMTLSRDEAEIARRSGISYREYAEQKLKFLEAKKADPEKYGTRG